MRNRIIQVTFIRDTRKRILEAQAKRMGEQLATLPVLLTQTQRTYYLRHPAALPEAALDGVRKDPRWRQAAGIARAVEYIRRNFCRKLREDDLARRAGMSTPQFSHIFHLHTGKRFTEFVNRLRIKRVKALLHQNHRPISEVALISGFPTRKHFQEVFKRSTHKTPAEYRRERLQA